MRWTDAVYKGAQDRLRIQGFVSVETKAMKPAASTHLFKVGSSFSRGEVFSCQKTLAERSLANEGSAELRSEASQPSLHKTLTHHRFPCPARFPETDGALRNYVQNLRSFHSIPQSPTKHRGVQGKASANGLRLDNASLQLVSKCAYPKRRTSARSLAAAFFCWIFDTARMVARVSAAANSPLSYFT